MRTEELRIYAENVILVYNFAVQCFPLNTSPQNILQHCHTNAKQPCQTQRKMLLDASGCLLEVKSNQEVCVHVAWQRCCLNNRCKLLGFLFFVWYCGTAAKKNLVSTRILRVQLQM